MSNLDLLYASLFSPQDWGIVLLVVLVVFGGSQIPKLARSLGQAQKEFKAGQAESDNPDKGDKRDEPKPPAES